MKINKKAYAKYAEAKAKKSPLLKDSILAFLSGGLICAFAEWLYQTYLNIGIEEDNVKILVPSSLIVLAALSTGFGFFDRIAKHAGAGTLVPITGFANSVVSPAIDNKAEGLVLGVGAKIFIVAGPVILYGTLASVIYGLGLYLFNLFA